MNWYEMGWESYACGRTPDDSYGRIALALRERFVVWTSDGERDAAVSGRFRHRNMEWPCTGDWVQLRDGSVIIDVLPRRTKLSRKEPGKEVREQVLAANIDVLFVVSGLDGDYNPRRLERYLVLARESGARPVVVLNKADVCSDVTSTVARTERYLCGATVLALSALTGEGLDELPRHVASAETAALIGSSGAGKSTIVNSLLGEARQRTTTVRESDSRGRHSTTCRELLAMPGGWLLMDLPGLRELHLWADLEGIDEAYNEIAELALDCKFRDCTHETEPGCAVREAGLAGGRLDSYHKLKREAAYLERQTDFHLARAQRKKWNALEKSVRRHPKRF